MNGTYCKSAYRFFKEYDEKDQQKSKVLKTSLVRHDCERSQASFLTG